MKIQHYNVIFFANYCDIFMLFQHASFYLGYWACRRADGKCSFHFSQLSTQKIHFLTGSSTVWKHLKSMTTLRHFSHHTVHNWPYILFHPQGPPSFHERDHKWNTTHMHADWRPGKRILNLRGVLVITFSLLHKTEKHWNETQVHSFDPNAAFVTQQW